MFQVFLIIFWATIRLQNRGEAVCDPSVSGADSSPWQGSQGRWLAAGGGNPSGSQPLRFASEPPPLDRGGNDDSLGRGAKDGGLRRCSLCLPC